jgi:hypothetical protein
MIKIADYVSWSDTWSLILREECRLRMLESRVLRRILGPKRDEVTGEWRRLHNKELYALYSPNIIRVIKSRRLRWAGHVARMGVLVRKPEERSQLEDPGVDGRILKWIFEKWDGGMDWIKLAHDRGR